MSVYESLLYLLTIVTPSNVHIMAFFVLAQLRFSTKPHLFFIQIIKGDEFTVHVSLT